MLIMASLLVRNVEVWITERIFPKGLENLFELEKFSQYRDLITERKLQEFLNEISQRL